MWVTKTNLIIYCSHFLSCWGNRMWMFGMGMFLVRIAGDSIQLSAIYGLATGLAIFFFGALVGDWVDNTPRLKAAQLSLVLQDVLMLGCAAVVTAFLWFTDDIRVSGSWLSPLLKGLIISLGVLSNLASQARVIAVERDWIVEICGKNSDHLASMTAMLRRIDMVSMVLAPMATGQVMGFTGLIYGAIFIGGWNVLSVFVEFYLMWKVYNTVPALKAKKNARRIDSAALELETKLDPDHQEDAQPSGKDQSHIATLAVTSTDPADNKNINGSHATEHRADTGSKRPHDAEEHSQSQLSKDSKAEIEGKIGENSSGVVGRLSRSRLLYQWVTLYRGWRTYVSYSVALPGLALSCLYMTVLGFDNITVAYAVTQGLSESTLGILMGSSAVFGIMGTFAYPVMRRHTGLTRTGFIALSSEVASLTLCVASIWMPGSPFDPLNERLSALPPGCLAASTSNASDLVTQTTLSASHGPAPTVNSLNSSKTVIDCDTKWVPDSPVSVIFLMAGIFLTRFGVWVADLTITQLFLEKVVPTQRGIVNGVQSSLNQLMDLLKFALVVILPDTHTFGFLIIISFTFVSSGCLLYAIFVRREGQALCLCGPGCTESPGEKPDGVDTQRNGAGCSVSVDAKNSIV